jgi:glycosyltransferase involved in cell wall biosynthesis
MDAGSDTVDDRSELGDLEIRLAHWHVNAWGGAEYLVTRLAKALNLDRVYTIGAPSPDDSNPYGAVEFYDVLQDLSMRPIRRLQSRAGRVFEYALWEDVDWRDYGHPDVLVTSGSTTRAVITPDDTLHVNYCHSPPRWFYDRYHDRKRSLVGKLSRPLLRHLRTRDVAVDPRVDRYFANSPVVARRLQKYYNRDAEVLYPPVDLARYRNDGDEGFYLHLGRLDAEKGVETVVDAFAETDRRLVLAGGAGDDAANVRDAIDRAPNVEYRGFVDEEVKYDLLARCRAVLFNARNEDFGIVPIEANASGKACLARNEGFPAIFVTDGVNGYKHDGTATSIRSVVQRFEAEGIDGNPAEGVDRFGFEAFEEQCVSQLLEWNDTFSLA